MLSQTTEYALRAVVFLATEPERPRTAREVADRTKVPGGYMSKVLHALGRAGLVEAQRGLHGGSVLTRPPERISILDVVNAIEPVQRIERCPLGIPGHAELCPLHRRLDEAAAMIERAFSSTTIADLLTEPSASRPLCDVTVSAEPRSGPAGRKKGGKRSGRRRKAAGARARR